MTIELASRGYLRRIRTVVVCGSPDVIDASPSQPEIESAVPEPMPAAPSIQAASSEQPTIQGATLQPASPTPGAPAVVGAPVLVPIIRGAKES